jgi:molybdopterin-binding protein
MTPSGPLVRVVINDGLPAALITRGSVRDMQPEESQPVAASLKATDAHLIPL